MVVLKTSNGRVIHEQEGEIEEADFRGLALHGVNLSGQQLVGCDFSRAGMSGANLVDADARDAIFDDANMQGLFAYSACFDGASLLRTDLYHSGLFMSSFRGANLSEALLQGADLKECNFQGAILCKADLGLNSFGGPTSLEGADFSEADVRETIWTGAVYDEKTIFPKGFYPEKHGLVFRASSPHRY